MEGGQRPTIFLFCFNFLENQRLNVESYVFSESSSSSWISASVHFASVRKKKTFPSTLFVIFKILFQVGQKTILVIFFLLARLKWYFVVDVFSFSLYQTFLFFRFITIFFNDFWCHPLFYQLRRWFFLFVFRVYFFWSSKNEVSG